MQEQARALGDPTRHAIFRYVARSPVPVGVAELNAEFPLNHNAIRQHLGKLVEAGLVTESTSAPEGRGRPRLLYTVDPRAQGHWDTIGPFERLASLLVEIIQSGDQPQYVGRRAAGQFRVPASGDVIADVETAMARQGFEPERLDNRSGADLVLHHCPFASVAVADRSTVCALHLGIAEGLVEDSDVSVDELIAYDPRQADCRVRLRNDEPGGARATEATLTLRRPRRRPR